MPIRPNMTRLNSKQYYQNKSNKIYSKEAQKTPVNSLQKKLFISMNAIIIVGFLIYKRDAIFSFIFKGDRSDAKYDMILDTSEGINKEEIVIGDSVGIKNKHAVEDEIKNINKINTKSDTNNKI